MTKNQQILATMGGSSLALLLSLGLGQQASAVTLVENLTQANVNTGLIDIGTWQGSSFTTGSSSYNLASATLLFRENASGNLFVRLYSDSSGVGTQIASFTNPASISGTLANNTFTLATPQALAANTTYWLISGVSSGSYSWGYTNSTNETGLPGWTIGDGYTYSNNQGGFWNLVDPDTPYQFSVNAVPEPLTILGTGVVLGAIPVLKKEYGKRKKKKDENA
jgi:hypothetical protein